MKPPLPKGRGTAVAVEGFKKVRNAQCAIKEDFPAENQEFFIYDRTMKRLLQRRSWRRRRLMRRYCLVVCTKYVQLWLLTLKLNNTIFTIICSYSLLLSPHPSRKLDTFSAGEGLILLIFALLRWQWCSAMFYHITAGASPCPTITS